MILTLTLHRWRAAVALAALVSVLAAPAVDAQLPYPSSEAIFKQYGFPAVSGLSHLCRQNVYPQGNPGWHLTWDAFASTSSPSSLVVEYRKKLGDAGFAQDGQGGLWRLPPNAPQVERTLQIVPAGTDGPYKSCARMPPAGSRSIITVSKKT